MPERFTAVGYDPPVADDVKLCTNCKTNPTGDNWMLCPACFARLDDTARNNPYGWMDQRAEDTAQ